MKIMLFETAPKTFVGVNDMDKLITKVSVLLEALPYIKRLYDKIVVIKFGGSTMSAPHVIQGILEDIVFMKFVGMKPVIIHGGGLAISEALRIRGIQPEFIKGMRVTDRETMDIVEETLMDTINAILVKQLKSLGAEAQGLSGRDNHLMEVEKLRMFVEPNKGETQPKEVDLGFVGQVKHVHTDVLHKVLAENQIPVIAPIGMGADELSYNINGDVVAGEIAAALHAQKLVYLTDVEGILKQVDDPSSLISTIHEPEIEMLIQQEVIKGGMIPKAKSCLKAMNDGAKKGHIIDGQVSHSLLLEIFTDQGVGTEIVP